MGTTKIQAVLNVNIRGIGLFVDFTRMALRLRYY